MWCRLVWQAPVCLHHTHTHTHSTSLHYYTHTHVHTCHITALLKCSRDFLSDQDKTPSPHLARRSSEVSPLRTVWTSPAAGSACCLCSGRPVPGSASLSSALTSGAWASIPSCWRLSSAQAATSLAVTDFVVVVAQSLSRVQLFVTYGL